MLLSLLSGLVVSVDAFFIGLSLGLQKKCRFMYLAVINLSLLGLCFAGFLLAGLVYELIPIDPDLVVGFAFIGLGLWFILHYFITCKRQAAALSIKSIAMVGLVMSGEAMLITMGLSLIFMPYSTWLIPVVVAAAHFGYSAISFHLARSKTMQRIPPAASHIISGAALIIYGLMAIFVEIEIS
ncbi:MAG: hypothetical protein FWC78_03750 [Defluviitaleaceae bacterium]|nr:hypothetical protein [Defluviitaleaceae bacterium]